MAAPFIQDVLEGVVEWRIVAGIRQDGVQLGLRLGELLAESFEQRFYDEACDGIIPADSSIIRKTIGQAEPIGIILNTAMTGHFPGLPISFQRQQPNDACRGDTDHPVDKPVLCAVATAVCWRNAAGVAGKR